MSQPASMVSLKRKKEVIPLLNVLKSMNSTDRIIILAHLDDKTRDDLYLTIDSVLKSEKVPIQAKLNLHKKLHHHKGHLKQLTNKTISKQTKKKKLIQIGGNPLKIILNVALPLMLDLFPK